MRNLPRMLLKHFKTALAVLLFCGMTSCVKDVDFDQAGNITLQPEIQADLLIFEIDQKEFTDPKTDLFRTVIRDTVRLDFLDDSYIQDDLTKVEFSFRYRNSFPQSFRNKISFLSERNRLQHRVEFVVEPGSNGNSRITEKIEIIGPENIQVIKRSIKMVVEIEAVTNDESFTGILRFESKGLFSFQF